MPKLLLNRLHWIAPSVAADFLALVVMAVAAHAPMIEVPRAFPAVLGDSSAPM